MRNTGRATIAYPVPQHFFERIQLLPEEFEKFMRAGMVLFLCSPFESEGGGVGSFRHDAPDRPFQRVCTRRKSGKITLRDGRPECIPGSGESSQERLQQAAKKRIVPHALAESLTIVEYADGRGSG